MHIPPFSHAVDLQTHANAGSLSTESKPLHPVQELVLVQPVHLLLQAYFLKEIFILKKN